jgi:N-acylneuraminate cytidylyltransferase
MMRSNGIVFKENLSMTDVKKPLAIIPARGGSKRFPRKNIAEMAGKPLLAYAIEAALESGVFDQVCVSSDDDEILIIAQKYGADTIQKRPADLAEDRVTLKGVCAYILHWFSSLNIHYSEFALLLATNPLRTPEDIRNAYRAFKEKKANYCMSVVRFSHPPQRAVWIQSGYVEPYFGKKYMKQTQLLEPLYRHDGSFIFAKTKVFMEKKEFYIDKVLPYIISENRSVDIDEPLDLEWAEFLFKRLNLR